MIKITCDKSDFSKLVTDCNQIINKNGCGACVLTNVCNKKIKDGVLPIVDITDINKQKANIRVND